MPPITENLILLLVLGGVFLSVPIALLIRTMFPRTQDESAGNSGPELPPDPAWLPAGVTIPAPSDNPWTTPQAGLLVLPAVPAVTLHGSWTKKDAWFALALALIMALLLGPLQAAGGGQGSPAQPIEFSAALFIGQLIFHAGMIGIVLGYLCVHRRLNAVQLFGLRQMSPLRTLGTALRWVVPGYFAIMIVSAAVLPLIEHLTGIELKQQLIVQNAPQISDRNTRFLMFLTLAAGAPVMEELIFRGVLYSIAARFIHPAYAAVATGVFFAVIHSNLMALVPLTLLGVLFAVAYQRTRSLAVPVLMHSLFNCSQFLLLLYGPHEFK